ncbi:hypothetical protein [Sphingomonas sp. M1A8_2b]
MLQMFATMLTLALAAPTSTPQRDAWRDCLFSYAQVESLGAKTPVQIVVEALDLCRPVRQLYLKALVGQSQATATRENSALAQAGSAMESDEKTVVRQVFAFVLRNRKV